MTRKNDRRPSSVDRPRSSQNDDLDARDKFVASAIATLITAITVAILLGGLILEQAEKERVPVAQAREIRR